MDELIFWKNRTLTDEEVKKLSELEVPNIYPTTDKIVAPLVYPAGDAIYDQPDITAGQGTGAGKLSDHTWRQLLQRNTTREVTA
jgi:hypothetical protein